MNGDCSGFTTFRAGDIIGNILTDREDTAFFVNPNGSSVLSSLTVGGSQVMRGTGTGVDLGTNWNTLGNTVNTIYEIYQGAFNVGGTGSSNFPSSASYKYGTLINFSANLNARAQMYISHNGNDLIFRGGWTDSSWQTWNKVLTDINYNSYAPTLTGTGASGTWSISITGNAGTATSLSSTTNFFINRGNVAAASIDSATGLGVWNQQNVGDSHTILAFGAGGSTSTVQQRFLYLGSMEFRNQTDSASWNAWKTVLTSANYSNYSNFGTASVYGGLYYDGNNTSYYVDPASNSQLNIVSLGAGSKLHLVSLADPNHYLRYAGTGFSGVTIDGAQLAGHQGGELVTNNGGDQWSLRWDAGGTTFSRASSRAPIFYDSNDTGFYMDGNGTTNLNAFQCGNFTSSDNAPTWTNSGLQYVEHLSSHIAYYKKAGIYDYYWRRSDSGYAGGANDTTMMQLNDSGTLSVVADVRAPIFYDSNDTGYYVDPNSSSVLHNIIARVGGVRLDRNYDSNALWFTGALDTNHALWNDYNGGPGVRGVAGSGFDGMKWNAYRGIHIRGGSSGQYNIIVAQNSGGAGNDHTVELYAANVKQFETESGYALATNQMRSPIFYNSNDTSVRWEQNNLVLRGTSPTVYFRDTDEMSAMIHVNSNLFYVLRGGVDTESWSTVANSAWPMLLNLSNNNALFGGLVEAITDVRAPIFYDSNNTGYYCNPAGSSVLYSVEMINQRCSFSRQWDNYPGISVYNTTDQGPQSDFRIFGSSGANGGDFSVRLLVDGEITSLTNVNAGSAMYTPIYYDSNNTGYYFDGSSGTVMNNATVGGKFYAQGATGVNECCGSDATVSVGGSSGRPPSISWHYSGVMQGNMQGNQTGWRKIYFYDDQGNGLGVHATGQIASNADVIAYYSDKRLKKDLVRVVDHWNVINNLNGYRFTWNEKSGEIPGFQDKVGKREVGLIAQDVQAVYPEAIAMRTEGPEDDPYMTIKHDRFTAVFIEALKDLRRELDEVKEENKKLREMINGQ
jgi:hypothetical protein